MPFVTVPSTESAEYINSQKSDYQDTYIVDNLNTLGGGGGGGGGASVGHISGSYFTVNGGSGCSAFIAWSDPNIISDTVTYNSCSNSFVFNCAGNYIVEMCHTVQTTCCSANSFYTVVQGYTANNCGCSCLSTCGADSLPWGYNNRTGVRLYFPNVQVGDYFRVSVQNDGGAWSTNYLSDRNNCLLTVTTIS